MASFNSVRRLSAMGHACLRQNTTTTAIGGPRRLVVSDAITSGGNRRDSSTNLRAVEILRPNFELYFRRDFASAAVTPKLLPEETEDREVSPQPNNSSENTPRKLYVERLRDDNPHWVPVHWVTTVYKQFFGGGASKSPPTSEEALLLLNCFDVRLADEAPANRVIMAEKAWQDLKNAGTALDVRHYNALMSVYLANEHAFDPEDFLQIMSEDGVTMNEESYLLLVRRYCQGGNLVDAMRTLEFMKRKEMKLTRPVFHALIEGHIRAGDLPGAAQIRVMMEKAYPSVTERDFSPALLAHARTGNVEKLLDTFVDMKARQLQPEVADVLRSLTAYLDWCAENNKYPESSALDSLYDTIETGRFTTGINSIIAQTVVQLTRQGFNDIAAELLALFPDNKMATYEFFLRATRTLPFTDVLRYCDQIGAKNASTSTSTSTASADIMTTYCLPHVRKLPFDQLQSVLIDAKECELPVEAITDIVVSRMPTAANVDDVRYLTGQAARGSPLERVVLLAIQLELPIVNDAAFWKKLFDDRRVSFDALLGRLTKAGGSKHDQISIDRYRPAIMSGYFESQLQSLKLDRLKRAVDFLKGHPEFQPSILNVGLVVGRLCFRHTSTLSTIPDAIELLRRCGRMNADDASFILRKVGTNNPGILPDLLEAFQSHEIVLKPKSLDLCLRTCNHDETKGAVMKYLETYRTNYLETSVLEKMTLKEVVDFQTDQRSFAFIIVKKAAEENDEETALKALEDVSPSGKTKALAAIFDMYVNGLSDGFKALEYLDVMLTQNEGRRDAVIELPISTVLKLIELLSRNGRSLADIQLFDEIKQTNNVKLVSLYEADLDRRVIQDHVNYLSELNEEKAVIDAYLNQLTSLNFGSYFIGTHVAAVLKKNGVREALELVKSYFGGISEDSNSGNQEAFQKASIPLEEELLDAIVASEDVSLLKDFLDISSVVHGERKSFLYLSFALYKGGKLAQGRRILNIPGLRAEEGMVPGFCERMLTEQRHDALENFCEDVCCLFGVDKAQLAFYKLRSIMARGDSLKALEYFNRILDEGRDLTPELRQQAAFLYAGLGLEFYDKSVTAKDFNVEAASSDAQASRFDGNMTEIVANIRRGDVEYSQEFYKYLVGTLLAKDPSPVLDALVRRGDLATLQYLDDDQNIAETKHRVAWLYLRENRLDELLMKCDGDGVKVVEKAEEYLSADNLQYIRTKEGRDEWIQEIEKWVKENGSQKGVLANLVGYHLSCSDVERAKALMDEYPVICQEGLVNLQHVNSYATLVDVAGMDLPDFVHNNVFYRLIHNATLWRMPNLVEDAVARMYASGVTFYVSPALKRRVKDCVGRDLFTKPVPKKVKEGEDKSGAVDASGDALDGVMEEHLATDAVGDLERSDEVPT